MCSVDKEIREASGAPCGKGGTFMEERGFDFDDNMRQSLETLNRLRSAFIFWMGAWG